MRSWQIWFGFPAPDSVNNSGVPTVYPTIYSNLPTMNITNSTTTQEPTYSPTIYHTLLPTVNVTMDPTNATNFTTTEQPNNSPTYSPNFVNDWFNVPSVTLNLGLYWDFFSKHLRARLSQQPHLRS